MKFSNLLSSTLREEPAEAEIPSHRLMLRAGMMRKVAGGIYTYLPLGYRVLKKIMEIVRDEMDRSGAQELMLPILQPAELWHTTGRWDEYGEEMFRIQDRHGRSFCLGPTHEEIITDLVKNEVRSYKQLPLTLYQMQNKYRDEIRPRFGVMRSREFIMKDAYSFDPDDASLDATYKRMYAAYESLFARCGLDARPVLADSGAIGGDATHEFMVLADSGEAEIVYCDRCTYAANVEKAQTRAPEAPSTSGDSIPSVEEVATPDVRTIDELADFLDTSPENMIKTLVYVADGTPVVALVRGDRELNEVKLARALNCSLLEAAPADVVERVTGAPVGFAGPVGLSGVRILADLEVPTITGAITGANKKDTHLVNVVSERDFTFDEIIDLRTAIAGDSCPQCDGKLGAARGIEVGQVFKLGTKYSQSLGATYLDEDGTERPCVMGCYGVGVTRTMAAVIEQNHDDDGIVWPVGIAPYHVDVIVIDTKSSEQMEVAQDLYESLWRTGVEAILDDRPERPGVKFKDADLIGFPLRVVVGPKSLAQDRVEVRVRATKADELVPLDRAVEYLRAQLETA